MACQTMELSQGNVREKPLTIVRIDWLLAACKLAELNRSWPPFLNANKQPKGTLCVQLKKRATRAPNSNIVFLTLTNKSCFEFGCQGWYLLVKGRFVWGTHQLSKKKIGKFSFAQNSVSVSSLPVALWEFLESTYWFYIQGVSRSRGVVVVY